MLTYRRRTAWRLFALVFALVAGLAIALGAMLSDARAQTAPPAPQYTFTKVADSVEDGFDPFSFGCAAINTPGDIAFRAGRLAPDGFNTIPGIYRANADGTLTTIAEDPKRFQTIGFNPSINDSGQVSFAARLDAVDKATGENIEVILRGDGSKKLTTIASTADEFNFFGFDTSISNSGEVAFKAELDEEFNFDEGLFSGSGGKKSGVTTHYLNSTDVTLDGQQVRFVGDDSRPSINIVGNIAFNESIQPNFDSGIFVGREGTFQTIAALDPNVFVGVPVLNDGELQPSRGPTSTRRTRSSSLRSCPAVATPSRRSPTREASSAHSASDPLRSTTRATWPSSPPSTMEPPESSWVPTPLKIV
jgi:hypothetical protein